MLTEFLSLDFKLNAKIRLNMKSIFYIILFTLFLFNSIQARFFFKRHCKQPGISRVLVHNINPRYSSEIVQGSNTTSINLKLNISWQVERPEDQQFDGFLIRFVKAVGREKSHEPINGCSSRNDYLWLKSQNLTFCANTTFTNSQCLQPATDLCLCPLESFSNLRENSSTKCLGTEMWLKKRGYLSIPSHIRSITFAANFSTAYSFDIKPYYREYVATTSTTPTTIPSKSDCVETLRENFPMSLQVAAETCCDAGIPHVIARNITLSVPEPDFRLGTVNITVTWLPPINQEYLTGFQEFPLNRNFFQGQPKHTTSKKINNPNPIDEGKCDKAKYHYQLTLYNLFPGGIYDFQVSSLYERAEMVKYGCHSGLCSTNIEFSIPDINVCEMGYCHDDAECVPDNTSGTNSLKAMCKCKDGFHGDGINTSWNKSSTGCDDVNYCKDKDLYCAPVASCQDNPAPLVGVTCQCPPDHYGDGYLSGSGCSSKTELGLKVGIPLTIAVMIIAIAIIWKERIFRVYKGTFKFAKFST